MVLPCLTGLLASTCAMWEEQLGHLQMMRSQRHAQTGERLSDAQLIPSLQLAGGCLDDET